VGLGHFFILNIFFIGSNQIFQANKLVKKKLATQKQKKHLAIVRDKSL
jgi:hypothetical protein